MSGNHEIVTQILFQVRIIQRYAVFAVLTRQPYIKSSASIVYPVLELRKWMDFWITRTLSRWCKEVLSDLADAILLCFLVNSLLTTGSS